MAFVKKSACCSSTFLVGIQIALGLSLQKQTPWLVPKHVWFLSKLGFRENIFLKEKTKSFFEYEIKIWNFKFLYPWNSPNLECFYLVIQVGSTGMNNDFRLPPTVVTWNSKLTSLTGPFWAYQGDDLKKKLWPLFKISRILADLCHIYIKWRRRINGKRKYLLHTLCFFFCIFSILSIHINYWSIILGPISQLIPCSSHCRYPNYQQTIYLGLCI